MDNSSTPDDCSYLGVGSASLSSPVPAGSRHMAVSQHSSTIPASMGQNFSRGTPTPLVSNAKAQMAIAAVQGTGVRLKRAFAGRRKKSEDVSLSRAARSRDHNDVPEPPSPASTKSSSSAKQMTLQILRGVKGGMLPNSQRTSLPPPLPPKPAGLSLKKPQEQPPQGQPAQSSSKDVDPRGSVMTVSPAITSALTFIKNNDLQTDKIIENNDKEADKEEQKQPDSEPPTQENKPAPAKEAWRKSDSTTHTVRPGATAGSRTSRPVSMADSLQSIHTIVPVNKRLSALASDASFGVPEEDTPPEVPTHSPTASLRLKNRRSASLNLGSTTPSKSAAAMPNSITEPKFPLKTIADSIARETPTLTRADANGIIAPSSMGMQSTGTNVRGRLAAWSATTNGTPERSMPPLHPQRTNESSRVPTAFQSQSFRQTAVSMTQPAAGLAKRAVEKMGRAWGGFGPSNNSGYSSSSSSNAPSSYSGHEHVFARPSSNQSSPGFFAGSPHKGKIRRTPDAPSGTWSLSSSVTSSSVSDHDAYSASIGPSVGIRLRGPQRPSGLVFGRELKACVRDTAVDRNRAPRHLSKMLANRSDLREVEQRALPAIVVRCFQHLMLWGVQEEGLFRVTGRPSHVSKLRAEFDNGADFDMADCTPGDLDPHAVASVFKAYLRELPEPILTHALLPHFEAAMNVESETHKGAAPEARAGARGPTLPSGPRGGVPMMRKPPSLSTLAMPSFSGIPRPSEKLVGELALLIARLPQENRDVMRTITEIINATAKVKATKMPLSNLLLVFCPSLSMNPPLLRIICENTSIWAPVVLDIKRTEPAVLDIASPEPIDTKNDLAPERSVPLDGDQTARPSTTNFALSSQISLQDSASYSSMSDKSSVDATFESQPDETPSLLSSSAESLSTPSTSSHSLPQLPVQEAEVVDSAPRISSPTIQVLNSPGSVKFPSGDSAPASPLLPKRSVPLLSFPAISSLSSPASPTASLKSKRLKRPSLNLLFSTKRSPPSISSPYSRRRSVSESDSSNSTPASAVTAPTGSIYRSDSVYTLPPVTIDAPVWDDLSLSQEVEERQSASINVSPPTGPTPISDFYRTPAGSTLSLCSPPQTAATEGSSTLRLKPARSKTSINSNYLGLLPENAVPGENLQEWTKSVFSNLDWKAGAQ